MMKNNKTLIFIALMGSLSVSLIHPQSAVSIITAARDRIKADTVSTRSRMVLTAKNGSPTKPMIIDQYEKDGPKGNRTIIVFQSPAVVAGTRFLTMDNPGNPADRWIYLPTIGKIRRIAASEGNGSFMGTDMSYDDISSMKRDVNLDTHTILKEDTLQGKPCYVIESIPKDSSYQYSKMIQWIDKTSMVSYRIELYDRRGNQTKLLEILELKDVQGRLSAMSTRMTTLGAGTSTTIYVEILKYDDPIPDGVFTTNYLETGRAPR